MESRYVGPEYESSNYEEYHLTVNTLEWLYSKARQNRVFEFICQESIQRVIEIGIGAYPLSCNSSTCTPKERLKVASVEPRSGFILQSNFGLRNDVENKIFNAKFEEIILSEVLNFLGETPNLIVLNSILHEIDDLKTFLSKLNSYVGPQTKIWVNVPNSNSLHLYAYERLKSSQLSNISEDSFRSVLSNRKNNFTAQTLIEIFSKFGIECTHVTSFGYKPFTFGQLESLYVPENATTLPQKETLVEMEIRELFGAELEMIFEPYGN